MKNMSSKYTEAQKKATTEYLKKLSNISIRVKEDEYNQIKSFAEKKGMSLRSFVLQAIHNEIERG